MMVDDGIGEIVATDVDGQIHDGIETGQGYGGGESVEADEGLLTF